MPVTAQKPSPAELRQQRLEASYSIRSVVFYTFVVDLDVAVKRRGYKHWLDIRLGDVHLLTLDVDVSVLDHMRDLQRDRSWSFEGVLPLLGNVITAVAAVMKAHGIDDEMTGYSQLIFKQARNP